MPIGLRSSGHGAIAALVVLVSLQSVEAAGLSPDIAATVDGQPIYVRQVERLVDQTLGNRQVPREVRARLKREALARLIDRAAIVERLRGRDEIASKNEIDAAIDDLTRRLARQDKTLAAYLEENQLTEEVLRAEYLWSLTWKHQLDKYRTDANLERYFKQHRRRFDGTTINVAQILRKINGDADEQNARRAQLERIRRDILDGKISFEDAARKWSDAPSGVDGGLVGWIGIAGPMAPEFTEAAFTLGVGQISTPVASSVGLHLIKCLAERPGKKNWQDVRPALGSAVAKYLFQWLAQHARGACAVRRNQALAWAKTAPEE